MTAIAIFVKTPGYSPVKSRLAQTVGQHLAETCHLMSAKAVAAVAESAGLGPVYWAVAESEAVGSATWKDLPILLQPPGDLGTRMQAIHDELVRRHDRALLLGADLPQIDRGSLQTADAWLDGRHSRGVIGPADDGGFWLVGANTPLPSQQWEAPQYGSQNVLERFLDAAGEGLDWQRLAARTDLDRIEDVSRVIEQLRNLSHPHPVQQRLLDWLVNHLSNQDLHQP
ncbi:MAG: DUF2064 domain-containing protein [Wenzhouxiangella sp.]|nr:DUF2064 domain-containing protein [Wenzhouxiangella sp.]